MSSASQSENAPRNVAAWPLREKPSLNASSSQRFTLTLLAAFLGGCEQQAPTPPPAADTGAKAAAKSFFEALIREDWTAAYDDIDADSRSRLTKDQFVARAQSAMKQMDFSPTEVGVSVSETGDRASAVAVYRGVSGTSTKQFKDGTTLKKTGDRWTVILRSNFGGAAASPTGKSK